MGDFSSNQGAAAPRARRSAGWRYSSATGGQTDTTKVTARAAVAGTRFGIHGFDYINTSANASEFEIYSGNNVIYRGYAPASMTAPVQIPNLSDQPLYTNAGELLGIKMATNSTATRFNVRGQDYDA